MKFKPITSFDSQFLYDLLKERQDYENISHQNLPSFYEHHCFVCSHPYKFWLIIDNIGTVYLTDRNEVCIHVFKEYVHLVPDIIKEIPSLVKGEYYYNINPDNKFMESILKENGFKLPKVDKMFEEIPQTLSVRTKDKNSTDFPSREARDKSGLVQNEEQRIEDRQMGVSSNAN